MSIRDTIRAAVDGSADLYEIPEWDVTLEVRSMTARARAVFVADMAAADGTVAGLDDPGRIEEMWWHVISQTCFDPETGDHAFVDEDREWFFEKNARVVNDLANECMAASGLTEEAQNDAGKDSSVSLTVVDGEAQSDALSSG